MISTEDRNLNNFTANIYQLILISIDWNWKLENNIRTKKLTKRHKKSLKNLKNSPKWWEN